MSKSRIVKSTEGTHAIGWGGGGGGTPERGDSFGQNAAGLRSGLATIRTKTGVPNDSPFIY